MTAHPLPAPGKGDDVPVTVGDLDTATLLALSVTQLHPGVRVGPGGRVPR